VYIMYKYTENLFGLTHWRKAKQPTPK